MSEELTPWTNEEFEEKLRAKSNLYHFNHPFHKLMHSGKLNKKQVHLCGNTLNSFKTI